jgi:hypothetical protein
LIFCGEAIVMFWGLSGRSLFDFFEVAIAILGVGEAIRLR